MININFIFIRITGEYYRLDYSENVLKSISVTSNELRSDFVKIERRQNMLCYFVV